MTLTSMRAAGDASLVTPRLLARARVLEETGVDGVHAGEQVYIGQKYLARTRRRRRFMPAAFSTAPMRPKVRPDFGFKIGGNLVCPWDRSRLARDVQRAIHQDAGAE